MALGPSITVSEPTSNQTVHSGDNGILSGYVKDASMNPIEGAKVRVYFHGTYEENYTDSSGHYNVTNIPICWCLKNATASKEGYITEWVLLAIGENTTYDFVLTPLDTIYVDDDNTQGPWDGTEEHPYQHIQDAIDNASEEDTIFVYNGVYKNNISIGGRPIGNESKINSNINIIGQDKNSTIIEGARFILNWCSFIKIKGFTIKNANVGINLYLCGYIIIAGNKIINNNYGLLLEMSGNNLIYENVIDSNNECAIEFRSILTWGYCEHNEIAINQISNNQIGIHLYGSSYLNKINYNNFYDNNLDAYNAASLLNNWNYNYWDGARILPKLIPGYYFIGGIDWHPAKEPYYIS